MPSAAMSESVYATATSCPAWAARKLVMKSLALGIVELRGQTGVPVVVADDEEATVDEGVAQLDRPRDQLRAESHDQQQRLVVRVAVGLVGDLDAVDGSDGGGHRIILTGS